MGFVGVDVLGVFVVESVVFNGGVGNEVVLGREFGIVVFPRVSSHSFKTKKFQTFKMRNSPEAVVGAKVVSLVDGVVNSVVGVVNSVVGIVHSVELVINFVSEVNSVDGVVDSVVGIVGSVVEVSVEYLYRFQY